MLNQVERKPNGEVYGRSGNIDFCGRIAYIWTEDKPRQYPNAVKVADGLWITRL